MLADQRIQGHSRLDAGRVEHVGEPPKANPQAVLSPAVVDDVRHDVAAVRRNTDPHGGIIIPNLHIGGDPDRKRLVARPRIRLSLENKRVLVAIRPAHRLAHDLGTGSDRRQAGGEDTCCPGEEETLLDEIPALVACPHDAALRSLAMTAPGLPSGRRLSPCRLASADLEQIPVEFTYNLRA